MPSAKHVFSEVQDAVQSSNFDIGYVMSKVRALLVSIFVLVATHFAGSMASRGIIRVGAPSGDEKEEGGSRVRRSDAFERRRQAVVQNVARLTYYVTMIVGFMIVFRLFGIEIATIIALICTLGFVLGMSLQGALSDITSGIIIAFFQTYHVGDIVHVDAFEGEVVDFRLINTVLKDVESGAVFTVPNSKMQGSIVTNYTREPFYDFSFTFNVSNNNRDIAGILAHVRKDLRSEKKYPAVLREGKGVPPPRVNIADISGWGTQIIVRVPIRVDMDLVSKRSQVRTGIRTLLNELDVTMMNRGETNLRDEKGGALRTTRGRGNDDTAEEEEEEEEEGAS